MKQKKLKKYLEIGVFNGHAFFKIKSNFKIAVDPEFQFDLFRKINKSIINPWNLYNKYFEKTSDNFFQEDAPGLFSETQIEIALIDGMHEYEYALRDIENTLKYLSKDGVIIIHDCNPLTKKASRTFSELQGAPITDVWNGDVWKAILHLRAERKDINCFVLDCDHGLGIVTKTSPESIVDIPVEKINSLTYEDFDTNRNHWLNLKPAGYANEYFNLEIS